MINKIDFNSLFKLFLILFVITTYFVGFFFRENAVGGGEADFISHTWPAIQSFKQDFFYTIKNYGIFHEGAYPLFHILNAYLNPFSNNVIAFQFSITIVSFFLFVFFSLILKKVYSKINYLDILVLSSVILLLPFFRTSAFWGLTENFGWFFMILSLFFFNEIKFEIQKNQSSEKLFTVFFFCLTSSCAIYTKQYFIFLPIIFLLYLFFYKANKKILLFSLAIYFLFAIPVFLLFFVWGGFFDERNFPGFFQKHFDPLFLLKNIPILTSFFGFYLLPVLIIEMFNKGIKILYKNYFKVFSITFSFLVVLSLFNILSYLGNYSLGGGAILKLNYIIIEQNYFLLLLFSSLGVSILFRFLKEDLKNNLIILLPILLIFNFPIILYQEYVEPLILILFFLLLKTDLQKIYFQKVFFSNLIILLYFFTYLSASIYLKHFVS